MGGESKEEVHLAVSSNLLPFKQARRRRML